MKKLYRILCFLLCCVLSLNGVCLAQAAGQEQQIMSVSPVATQQQRMWCGSNYDTTDWVYEPWGYLGYGKVLYARFLNDSTSGTVHQYVIRFDALAKSNERTLYMAALALSDESALAVETDLTAATSTRKVTSTMAGDKLMTTSKGYYKNEVKDRVVAYTKSVASNTPVSDSVSYAHGTYEYPVSFELDVTAYVQSAFAAGKRNVQFVLIPARQVMNGSVNVAELDGFDHYANGKVYDEAGQVLQNVSELSLDTSIPVAGKQDYYAVTPANDLYFSWMEVKRDTIRMDLKLISDDEIFARFKQNAVNVGAMARHLSDISSLLSASAYQIYRELSVSYPVIDELLFAELSECENAADFAAAFYSTVIRNRFNGYPCGFRLDSTLAQRRGSITLGGDYPRACYAYIKTYDYADRVQQSVAFPIKDGKGYYNIYTEEFYDEKMSVTITADEEGKVPLSKTEHFELEEVVLPELFITELSNMHTNSYASDSGTAENQGSWTQCYQYIELHNYSDYEMDLEELDFVYYDGKERTFDWILESGGSLIIDPHETYVIGVYTGYSYYTNGHTYATSSERTKYWNDFEKYYGVEIPKTNRVMIACVPSGTAAYGSDATLRRSKDAGVTCYAALRDGGNTVTKVMLPDSKPHRGYAYQFVPDGTDNVTEQLLFATGCFPYQLLREQRIDYCENVPFNIYDDINVLSYNVLAEETYFTVKDRIPRLIKVLDTYHPDIIGFQEFNYSWAAQLPARMPQQYAVIEGISTYNHTFSNASGTWDLLNPIYYRSDKFTVLESGAAFMTPDGQQSTKQWDSVNMKRTMTWAVLKDKTTGEIFNVINAHLVLSGKTARVEQVKQIYNKGAALQQKYGGGIIALGDHNMQEASEPYQAYLKGGVLVDAKYETANHNSKDTAPAVNKYDGDYGVPIDFVMISPETIGVKEYHVFDGIFPDGPVSDHSGLLVTLYTKGYEDEEAPLISGVENGAVYCERASFTVLEEHPAILTLNGAPLNEKSVTVTTPGSYTVTAEDVLGRRSEVTFTVAAHQWKSGFTVDTLATCKTPGSKSIHCKLCDQKKPDSITVIPVTGQHTAGELIVDEAASCTAAGKGHKDCTVCGERAESDIVIAKLAHKAGDWKTVKEPTAKTEGLKEMRCKRCNTLLDSKTLPKKAPAVSFTDVKKSDFFYTPVQWAVELGVTTGTSKTTFGPEESCTRAQAVTFLWRAAGQPTVKNAKNPFTDVKKSDYFYKAVLWAAESGVTSGTSKTEFSPNEACTRGQIVTFLWRAQSGKKVSAANPFKDVKATDFYYNAVLWAVKNGVTTGTSKTTFGPAETCTRGQIVTFLYRAMV